MNYSSNTINIPVRARIHHHGLLIPKHIKRIPWKFRFHTYARVEFPIPVHNENMQFFSRFFGILGLYEKKIALIYKLLPNNLYKIII